MTPFSPRKRRTLFGILVLIFVVCAPLLGAYSAGYRFDDALTLVATGGIYIQSDLSNTRVFVNDEFVRQGGVLLRNTYVRSLRTGRVHRVYVERDDYTSWRKELYVQPNLVTEARVFMVPLDREWRVIASTTKVALPDAQSTTTVPDPRTAAVRATSTEVTNPEFVTLTRYFEDALDQFEVEVATTTLEVVRGQVVASTSIITELQLPRWLATLASTTGFIDAEQIRERGGIVAWLENGVVHTIWGNVENAPPHFFCVIECRERVSIDWDEDIVHYEFFPNRDDALLVLTERGLFALELDDRGGRTIIPLFAGSGLTFRVRDGSTIVVYDGTLFHQLIM